MYRRMEPLLRFEGSRRARVHRGLLGLYSGKQTAGTLYVGVTNDLLRRTCEHRQGLAAGFTIRYSVHMLVYYERHDTPHAAIQREKNIKHWPRAWKIDLVLTINPQWRDLYDELF